jgi:hypothetical protein
MSRELALDTILLKETDRFAHTEYSLDYHNSYITDITGLPEGHPERQRSFYAFANIDFIWSINDGIHANWSEFGRATNMGHAEYASDGSDMRASHTSPFSDENDVWAFNAVTEYGLPEFRAQVNAYEEQVVQAKITHPDQLVTGGYYKTIVSGAIDAFGWDMLLIGSSDLTKMERVYDSFFQRTLFHMKAWAETSVDVIIQHDDFVWTEGPFMNPHFYRSAIIPRYAELWKPLKQAGKKILFCSDGDFTMFAEDIVNAGADGLIFEPVCDFEFMVDRFGANTVLVGSDVDCRDLTFHSWDVVKDKIDRTIELGSRCKGLIIAVGNHMPPNISSEMVDNYLRYLNVCLSKRPEYTSRV